MDIRSKRVYRAQRQADGFRVLVDRLRPRGLTKERMRLDWWARELAPSTALRQWYGHEADRWEEFTRRHAKELDGNGEAVASLLARAREGPVTLLYPAKDEERNSAVALEAYLEARAKEESAR